MSARATQTIQARPVMATNPKPRILDVGCGRKKYPGSIGIDMSAAGQADVLCDWTRTPFADSTFDEVRLIHMIEEVDDIFKVLAEAHRVAKPGARVVIMTPHYTDHASYCSPAHRWHLSSFSLWFFSENPLSTITTLPRNSASAACTSPCCASGARSVFSS